MQMRKGNIGIDSTFTLVMMFIVILLLLSIVYTIVDRNPEGVYCSKIYKVIRVFGLKISDKQCNVQETYISENLPIRYELTTKFGDGDYKKELFFTQDVNRNTAYIYIPNGSYIDNAFIEVNPLPLIFTVGTINVNFVENKINFTAALRQFIENECQGDPCSIPLIFTANPNTLLNIYNLYVNHAQRSLNYGIANLIIDCWEKADLGNYQEDMFCNEVIITNNLIYEEPITESKVTEYIIKRKLCDILPNQDHGCGDEDKIIFKNEFYEKSNIVISYINQKIVLE